MELVAWADGVCEFAGRRTRCALGRSGVRPAGAKREGDGATPAGAWPIRRVLFRSDRRPAPVTALPVSPIGPADGWCDAPADAAYNRPVTLPYPASAERLWRDDGLYDLVAPLGYNDAPPIAAAGSAIFLHLMRPDGGPTDGCIALGASDLDAALALAGPASLVRIHAHRCPRR